MIPALLLALALAFASAAEAPPKPLGPAELCAEADTIAGYLKDFETLETGAEAPGVKAQIDGDIAELVLSGELIIARTALAGPELRKKLEPCAEKVRTIVERVQRYKSMRAAAGHEALKRLGRAPLPKDSPVAWNQNFQSFEAEKDGSPQSVSPDEAYALLANPPPPKAMPAEPRAPVKTAAVEAPAAPEGGLKIPPAESLASAFDGSQPGSPDLAAAVSPAMISPPPAVSPPPGLERLTPAARLPRSAEQAKQAAALAALTLPLIPETAREAAKIQLARLRDQQLSDERAFEIRKRLAELELLEGSESEEVHYRGRGYDFILKGRPEHLDHALKQWLAEQDEFFSKRKEAWHGELVARQRAHRLESMQNGSMPDGTDVDGILDSDLLARLKFDPKKTKAVKSTIEGKPGILLETEVYRPVGSFVRRHFISADGSLESEVGKTAQAADLETRLYYEDGKLARRSTTVKTPKHGLEQEPLEEIILERFGPGGQVLERIAERHLSGKKDDLTRYVPEGKRTVVEEHAVVTTRFNESGAPIELVSESWTKGKRAHVSRSSYDPATGRCTAMREFGADGAALESETLFSADGSVSVREPGKRLLQKGKLVADKKSGRSSIRLREGVIEGTNHSFILDARGVMIFDLSKERDLAPLVKAGLIQADKSGRSEQARVLLEQLQPALDAVADGSHQMQGPQLVLEPGGPVLLYTLTTGRITRSVRLAYDAGRWTEFERRSMSNDRGLPPSSSDRVTIYACCDQKGHFTQKEVFDQILDIKQIGAEFEEVAKTKSAQYLWDGQDWKKITENRPKSESFGIFKIAVNNISYTFEHVHGYKQLGQVGEALAEAGKSFRAHAVKLTNEVKEDFGLEVTFDQKLFAAASNLETWAGKGDKADIAAAGRLGRELLEEYRQHLMANAEQSPEEMARLSRQDLSKVSDEELAQFVAQKYGWAGSGDQLFEEAKKKGFSKAGIGAAAIAVTFKGGTIVTESLGPVALGKALSALGKLAPASAGSETAAAARGSRLSSAVGQTAKGIEKFREAYDVGDDLRDNLERATKFAEGKYFDLAAEYAARRVSQAGRKQKDPYDEVRQKYGLAAAVMLKAGWRPDAESFTLHRPGAKRPKDDSAGRKTGDWVEDSLPKDHWMNDADPTPLFGAKPLTLEAKVAKVLADEAKAARPATEAEIAGAAAEIRKRVEQGQRGPNLLVRPDSPAAEVVARREGELKKAFQEAIAADLAKPDLAPEKRAQLIALDAEISNGRLKIEFQKTAEQLAPDSKAERQGNKLVFHIDTLAVNPKAIAPIVLHEGVHGMHFEGSSRVDATMPKGEGWTPLKSLASEQIAHEAQIPPMEAYLRTEGFDPSKPIDWQAVKAKVGEPTARFAYAVMAYKESKAGGAKTGWDHFIDPRRGPVYQKRFGITPDDGPTIAHGKTVRGLLEIRGVLEGKLSETDPAQTRKAYDALEAEIFKAGRDSPEGKKLVNRQEALLQNLSERAAYARSLADLDSTLTRIKAEAKPQLEAAKADAQARLRDIQPHKDSIQNELNAAKSQAERDFLLKKHAGAIAKIKANEAAARKDLAAAEAAMAMKTPAAAPATAPRAPDAFAAQSDGALARAKKAAAEILPRSLAGFLGLGPEPPAAPAERPGARPSAPKSPALPERISPDQIVLPDDPASAMVRAGKLQTAGPFETPYGQVWLKKESAGTPEHGNTGLARAQARGFDVPEVGRVSLNGTEYLVIKNARGMTLRQAAEAGVKIPEAHWKPLQEGLSAMGKDFAHGDINNTNVLYDPATGRFTLIDWATMKSRKAFPEKFDGFVKEDLGKLDALKKQYGSPQSDGGDPFAAPRDEAGARRSPPESPLSEAAYQAQIRDLHARANKAKDNRASPGGAEGYYAEARVIRELWQEGRKAGGDPLISAGEKLSAVESKAGAKILRSTDGLFPQIFPDKVIVEIPRGAAAGAGGTVRAAIKEAKAQGKAVVLVFDKKDAGSPEAKRHQDSVREAKVPLQTEQVSERVWQEIDAETRTSIVEVASGEALGKMDQVRRLVKIARARRKGLTIYLDGGKASSKALGNYEKIVREENALWKAAYAQGGGSGEPWEVKLDVRDIPPR